MQRHDNDKDPLTSDELIAEFHRVATELGTTPTWAKFDSRARVSSATVKKRFGGLQGTLKHYRDWLETNAPDSPLLLKLQTKSKHEIPSPPSQPQSDPSRTAWTKLDGTEFENADQLSRASPCADQRTRRRVLVRHGRLRTGLIVEAVQTGFPDCEAKRCVNTRDNRWQRVRIEFEFRSRNFRDHGHDAA